MVTTWYQPPKAADDCFDKFESFLKLADFKYKEIYILGDLNCNMLYSNCTMPIQYHTSRLIDILNNFHKSQIISEPTRVTQTTESFIDHCIANGQENIAASGVYPVSISDHNLIYAVRKLGISRGNPKLRFVDLNLTPRVILRVLRFSFLCKFDFHAKI